MANLLLLGSAPIPILNPSWRPKSQAFIPSRNLSFRTLTKQKFSWHGRRFSKCWAGGGINGLYSQGNTKTVFPGGLKRAEVKLPGLVLRVAADEVMQSEGTLKLIDSAVSKGFGIVVLEEGVGNGRGGQLYEAACAVKALVRGRAQLLVAERVDIAAAAGATGVLLSDQGLSAVIARNMMQRAVLESTLLPLVARTVTDAKSARCATVTEGADLLMLLIENSEDVDVLVESICPNVSVPVFIILDSLEVSTLASLTSKLTRAGASGLVISVEDVTQLRDDILREIKSSLSGIYLTDKNSKQHANEDFPWMKMGNDINSNLKEATQNIKSLDLKVKEILDEEQPLLLEVINLIHEATPQVEEISLLVEAVAQLDKLFLLVIVVILC